MDSDLYQQAWHAQSSQTRVTIDADLLLKEVQRSQRHFRATIFWRDFREVAVGLLMLPLWFYLGSSLSLPWTWYLVVPAIIWVAGFILMDRIRHKQKPGKPGDPLLECVQASLTQLEHQIWLLRNVFWWYLLPFTIAILAFFAQVAWLKHNGFWPIILALAPNVLFLLGLYGFVYYLNQRVVRRDFEPRRQELLTLLASLSDETTGQHALTNSSQSATGSGRRMLRRSFVVAGLCVVALVLVFLAGGLFESGADRPAVPIEDAELFRARIDEFLDAARSKTGFSGAVLVARHGQPVYEGAFGFSHLDSQAPNTLDTPFRIASLSKQFTAAAIFRLDAQEKLSIDDPVHRYLPEFAEAPYRDITIHHLLTHTSGLPRSPKNTLDSLRWAAMSKAATPVEDYVRLAAKTPLEFEPGADYQYSNFGYRVLAALIAQVTGREYADYMEEEVFRPLGMNDSGVARVTRPPSEARVAEGLTQWRLPFASQPRFANGENGRNYGAGYGSGGIYTSANDLLRWDRVLAGDEFLSDRQKSRLFQPIHGNYACGWIVKKSDLDGRLYQMHNGANEGFFSQMMRLPEDDLVIIAVGNVDDTPALDEALEQLFRLCRSLPYRDP
jgi:CubicO group peptidase (beta-lactamase class C family)